MTSLFTFETTHHALWAEEVVTMQGIACELVPAPPAAAARCNLALHTDPAEVEETETALRREGVPFRLFTER